MATESRSQRYQRVLVLLGRVGAELSQALEERVADADLSKNLPVVVLCELSLRGPLRPRQLQTATGLSSGGVSRLLDRLESQRFVTRTYGTLGDRRAAVIELTAEGRRVADQLAHAVGDREELLRSVIAEIGELLRDDSAPRGDRGRRWNGNSEA